MKTNKKAVFFALLAAVLYAVNSPFSKLLLESFNVTYTSFNELYELATLATICDVVELMDENRIIVKKGLSRARAFAAPCARRPPGTADSWADALQRPDSDGSPPAARP